MSSSELFPISPKNLATVHTSVMLRRLIDNAPPDYFSLDWLVDNMPERSYGIVILFLAFISLLPFIGIFARLFIMFFALQVICGYRSPHLPERIMARKMSSRYLRRLPPSAFLALSHIEKFIRPRWGKLLGTRRLSGALLFLISLVSLIIPVPFANVPAAFIAALMALAYLEHDGLLLIIAQISSAVLLALTLVAFGSAFKIYIS